MRAPLVVIASLAAGASVARADSPPRIAIGRPTGGARIAHVNAGFETSPQRVVAKLALALTGRDAVARDISLQLRLPAGAHAIELAIPGFAAGYAIAQDQAREEYAYTIRHYQDDPVLLEWRGQTPAGGDLLLLRAYPVSNVGPLTVEVTIELPPTATLSLDVGNQAVPAWVNDHELRLRGATAISLAPAPAPPTRELYSEPLVIAPHKSTLARDQVGPQTSLLAGSLGGPSSDPVTAVLAPPEPDAPIAGPDKDMISDVVGLHRAQLRRCYTYEAQRDRSLAGTVVMRFAIQPDGTTAVHPFDGTLASDRVRTCIASEVATWRFSHSDEATEVTYPLAFSLRH